MNDELFDEMMESVRQGGAILRGEMEPGRTGDASDTGGPDLATVAAFVP